MARQMARLMTALVLAFGTAGMLTYAHELDKTIAGLPKDLDNPDGCPADFPIVVQNIKPGTLGDDNLDGTVCTADYTSYVDNNAKPAPQDTRHVTGHGNFIAGGGKELGDPQDISFSFHGIGINGSDDQAKGQFEFHDQTPDGPDLTVHGEVLCLTVSGNTATLIGLVTRSNDFELPVDRLVTWRTIDNGEGTNAEPDTVSRPSLVITKRSVGCQSKLLKFVDEDIVSGNIQVDEDETSGGVPTTLEKKEADDVDKESWGVSGHGNFFDGGKKLVQDISFSFHAIGEGVDGKFLESVAKGDFEYHDQTPGGPDLTVHGDVLCASVSLNTVRLVGVVTRSNDKGLPVDTIVGWAAEDNGEPGAAGPDRVSRLAPIGVKVPKGLCSGKLPAMTLQPVLNGNIQVR